MTKLLHIRLWIVFMLCGTVFNARAQITVTTGIPSSTSSGSGGTLPSLTFIVENTNSTPIAITDIDMYRASNSSGNTFTLHYSSTSLSGAPTIATPTWTVITSAVQSAVTTTAIHPSFTGMYFTIPANTVYRFAVTTSGSNFNYGGATSTPNSFSNGGVTIGTGNYQINSANVGYWNSTSPRFWAGTITFVPVGPCTSPPTPGTVTIDNITPCLGQNVDLGLTGNSFGTGQTFQWESATNVSGTWTPEGSPNPIHNITVTPAAIGTIYYRCAVTCGTSTSYSDTVAVTVPALFPGGNYTINAAVPTGGSNFQSFTDAVAAIKCGITSSITFDVAPGSGPYNEQIDLPATIGADPTKTVTFNGNGNTITQTLTSNTGNYATINLDGADYISFNNLNIEALGTTYGFGVHLMNSADNNSFNNCSITASTTATSTSSGCVSMSASPTSYSTGGVNGKNNSFDSCNLSGGYFGFCFYGTTSGDTNNSVTNCSVTDFYIYGIYALYQRSASINNNIVERPTRTTLSTGYGIMLSSGCSDMWVEKNTVRTLFGTDPNTTSTAYPLYCGSDGAAGTENRFYNNLVYDIKTNGTVGGMYLTSADYIQAYHNTIVLDNSSATGGTTYGIYSSGTVGGIDIQNNNISIVKGGFDPKYGLYYSNTTTRTSNYNNLYVNAPTGTGFVGYQGSGYATLAAWQGANPSWDALSTAEDPMFSSTGFIPGNALLDNTGTPLVSVTTDILNNLRDVSTPDVGAYEYIVPSCSGTPVAGTASAADTTVCLSGPVTLSLSGNSTGQGITIQWEEAPTASGPWFAVASGGNSTTFNFNFAMPMYYRAAVTCTNTSTTVYSDTVFINQAPFYFCYCSPMTGVVLHTSMVNYLTNVNIPGTTLNNTTSGYGPGAYTPTDPNIPTQTATVYENVAFTLNTVMSTSFGSTEAWIDWDQSGTFDAAEYYALTHTGTAGTVSITPPSGVLTGLTGMRVRVAYNSAGAFGSSGACSNISAGRETEDYVITVMPAPSCPPPSALATANSTTTSVDINWTSNSTATQYQVEYAQGFGFTVGTGTRVGPTGVTNPYTVPGLTPNMPYTFYVREICGPGDTSNWTGPVTAYTFPPVPTNDDCMTPIDISNGALYYGTNANATQTLAPCDATTTSATDVWYTFTTGSTAGVVNDSVNTSFSGGDVVVQMYSGTCGSLTPIVPTAGTTFNTTTGCVDGPAAGMEWSSYNLAANTTYFIRVYAFGTTVPGAFSIQITNAPLAIKLDKIAATNVGSSNRIDWNTLSEDQGDKFELQRSVDGKNFVTIYDQGANGVGSRYTYMDNNAVKGQNYYRLRMTAANGGTAYSETVSAIVKFSGFEVQAFPNPVSHNLTVKVNGLQGADAAVQVTDLTGKVIKTVKMNANVEDINMSGLANGIYLIKYSDVSHTQTIRVNKQ